MQSSDSVPSRAVTESDEAPAETKKFILERDNGICQCCGSANIADLHVDHIKPRSLGGSHDPGNLQILCSTCNILKSNNEIDFTSDNPLGEIVDFRVDWQNLTDDRDIEALKIFICRLVNMHYGCKAISGEDIVIGQRGEKARHWIIKVGKKHKTTTLKPKLDELKHRINEMRLKRNGIQVERIQATH